MSKRSNSKSRYKGRKRGSRDTVVKEEDNVLPGQNVRGSKFGSTSIRGLATEKAGVSKSNSSYIPQHGSEEEHNPGTSNKKHPKVGYRHKRKPPSTLQKITPNSLDVKQRRKTGDSRCCASSGEASSATCSSHSSANELDIPGFYYDKEKKRYFKIAPNHSTLSVTNDSIAKKEAEIKRKHDLQTTFSKDTVTNAVSNSCAYKSSKNVTNLILNVSIGNLHSEQLLSKVVHNTVSHLKPLSSQHLFEQQALGPYEKLEHMHMMRSSPSHSDLLCLWSLKETWVQRIQLVKLTEKSRNSSGKGLSLCAEPHEKVIVQSLNKVTDMCWAPMSGDSDKKTILYTTMCHTGYLYSLAMVRSMVADTEQEEPTSLHYNLGGKATWSCAWNRQKQQFCVGSEKCALMLNVERRTMMPKVYITNNSDPLSLTFSRQTGNCLFTGTRKGQILTHDMRGRSTRPVLMMRHRSGVCDIQLLSNDVSLISADFTGKVCMWDIRKHGVVVEYSGNKNLYTKIPVHVDEYEKIVYTVGEDGYTRFWDLRLGHLLHTIPPPCSVTRETIPVVHFSMGWGNRQGNAGLVMGLENKLHYYGHLSFP